MITRMMNGSEVPALGLTTLGLKGPEGERAVRYAVELGYRRFDTAQHYGNEEMVGDAMASSGLDRSAFFVTTKVWRDDLAGEAVRKGIVESLHKLRSDYVDLLLIHWPNESIPLSETLDAFQAIKANGQVRHIGVSNFPIALLQQATDRPGLIIATDQIEYHPFIDQSRMLAFLRSKQILLTAYMPLASGKVRENALLQEIGAARNKTAEQIALRWLVQQDGVTTIHRSAREADIQANFEIFDFELDPAEMERIDGLRGNMRLSNPAWAPAWDPF